ncbi:MAG: hypothetical protein ACK5P7_04305 [Bdellovibrio sp.]
MGWDKYFTDVLGVSEIVMPVREVFAQASRSELSSERLLFLGLQESTPLLELGIFQKMLLAMKLEFGEFAVWEMSVLELSTQEKQIPSGIVVVSFAPAITEFLRQQRPQLQLISTSHPLACLEKPQLKKQVWEDLKKALSDAGLSDRL